MNKGALRIKENAHEKLLAEHKAVKTELLENKTRLSRKVANALFLQDQSVKKINDHNELKKKFEEQAKQLAFAKKKQNEL